jgi:hypothetical protein
VKWEGRTAWFESNKRSVSGEEKCAIVAGVVNLASRMDRRTYKGNNQIGKEGKGLELQGETCCEDVLMPGRRVWVGVVRLVVQLLGGLLQKAEWNVEHRRTLEFENVCPRVLSLEFDQESESESSAKTSKLRRCQRKAMAPPACHPHPGAPQILRKKWGTSDFPNKFGQCTMEAEQEDKGEEIAATEATTNTWSQLQGTPNSFRTRCSAVTEYAADTKDVPNNFLKGEWEEFRPSTCSKIPGLNCKTPPHTHTVPPGIKWSPDGLCLLACAEDNTLRLYEIPPEIEGISKTEATWLPEQQCMSSVITVREGETIYDMAWLPGMNSADPATCCFFSTSRDHPVHVWDAFTGVSRGSFCAYTDAEELEAGDFDAFFPSFFEG